MKSIKLTLLLVFVGLFNEGYSQINNYTPGTSWNLCSSFNMLLIDINPPLFPPRYQCSGGHITLYFYFQYNPSTTGVQQIFHANVHYQYSYSVYGGFSSYNDGVTAMNLGTAPLVAYDTITTPLSSTDYNADLEASKYYFVKVVVKYCSGGVQITPGGWSANCRRSYQLDPCEDCLPAFTPNDKKFVLSAWVSEGAHPNTKTAFTTPSIVVTDNSTSTSYTFHPSGQVIDGWQRIEGIFQGASNGDMTLTLNGGGEDTYFDDIRIFPNDGSMMSYVYDPVTLRLVAELDERNYAKFYEYDEEGKLVRVKKETEQGIMTIQENRENSSLKASE